MQTEQDFDQKKNEQDSLQNRQKTLQSHFFFGFFLFTHTSMWNY